MKLQLLAAVLVLIPASLAAQLRLPQIMTVTPDVSFRLWVPAGTVRVETWDKNTIQITGTVAKNAHLFGGGGGRAVKFGAELNNLKDTTLARADLVVTVPRHAHLWIKMTDGEVTATATRGELEVITVTGTVAVKDAEGVVSVETIDGAVSLERINGAVRVRGGGGRVGLSEISGTLTASTVSGALDLQGNVISDVRLETIGGPIQLRGSVAPKALIELETHSGPITLHLPASRAPALTLSSRTGVVKNALSRVKGGVGQIIARSFKGDINVLALPGIERRKPNL